MKLTSTLILTLSASATLVFLSACKPAQPTAEPSATPAASPAATSAATSEPVPTESAAKADQPAEPVVEEEAVVEVELKDPVAVVNGSPITRDELLEAFNGVLQGSGANVADLTPDQKQEAYAQLLDDLIMDKLVAQAAESVDVPQEEVDAEISKIKARFPSEEEFEKRITEAGQSPEKLAEVISRMMKQQKWMESQVADKVVLTEEDAKTFYDANPEEFEEPETVKASHILILVNKDDSEAVVESKLEEAKKAAARAKKEGFEKVAKEVSEEPGASDSGGDLGYFSKDRMVPEFAEAAFAQEVGAIGEPVRTQYGWHVIEVTDKKPAGKASFDEVKSQLMAYLKTTKQRDAVQALLKTMRDSANIESTLPAPKPPTAMMPPTGGAEQGQNEESN